MKTVIFDIETVPADFDAMDQLQKEYLLKYCDSPEEEENVKVQMALWAPTNEIVAIGMLSAESDSGAVYYQAGANKVEEFEENGIKYVSGNEAEILEMFWKAISYANKFVTFNGRGFDCPVLMLRSAMQKVKPTKNLMPYRYSAEAHIDLLEQFTFYGAYRKFNLDTYCRSFGIKSSKEDGITGKDVKPLYEAGEYQAIARYCARDLYSTKDLYMRWSEFLQF